VQVRSDVLPGKVVEGRLTAINPGVDPVTRNIRAQATLENNNKILRPGMFVRVSVLLPRQDDVLVIPATAVLYAPYGDAVFVVDRKKGKDAGKGLVLRKQVIRTGAARGDFISVTSGLKEGETVVTTGVFKFRNGQPAVVDNTLSPEFRLDPEPDNR